MTSLRIQNDDVVDLPPSCKLVYLVLQEDGAVTLSELIDKTTLPNRTVRRAISRLVDRDLVERRPFVGDARQELFELVD